MQPRRSGPWIDITMEFGAAGGTWPGDTPMTSSFTGRIGEGRWAVNLTQFCSSPHNGTHSDAPLHVDPQGAASESLDVSAYLGPCWVVDATRSRRPALPADVLTRSRLRTESRFLFKTRSGPVPESFPAGFKGLSLELAQKLAAGGAALVGTDAPSVDAADSKGLAAHKALFSAGTTILENLNLHRVRPGRYELVALPLKVRGLCAAPVRAVLRPLGPRLVRFRTNPGDS